MIFFAESASRYSSFCPGMIFSENRHPLFGVMPALTQLDVPVQIALTLWETGLLSG
jgi:hypothetical protein